MADIKSFIKTFGKLLPPGKYAELAAKEAAEAAAKAGKEFKPGELVRTVSPPRVEGVNPKFKEARLETLKQIAEENPTPENLRQLDEARKDLIGEIESAPKSVEEQAAASRLEEFVGSDKKKPEVLTRDQMRQKREFDKIKQEVDAAKEESDKTPIMSSDDLTKKAAIIAALTGGTLAASSLVPEKAEAGVRGSALARSNLLKKFEPLMDKWTSGFKGTSGGRELREVLSSQLELDPTGLAKQEALRRLAAKTEVRQNPITGEHEFKVYRGDSPEFISEKRYEKEPFSYTTDPKVAQEFADAYGGKAHETWLPSSKVGSIPSVMKEGKYLSSEKEVIGKPFSGPFSEYSKKPETLHQKITSRGQSSPEEIDDIIGELMSEGSQGKKAAAIAAAVGGAGLLGSEEAKASVPTVEDAVKKAQSKYGASEEEIGKSIQTAAETISPFSKLMTFLTPTQTVSEKQEKAELDRFKELKQRLQPELAQNILE
jgi:hypothetical protein